MIFITRGNNNGLEVLFPQQRMQRRGGRGKMDQTPTGTPPMKKTEQLDQALPHSKVSSLPGADTEGSSRATNLQGSGVDLTGVFKQITPSQESRKGPADTPGQQSQTAAQSATKVFGAVPSQQSNPELGFTQVFRALTESETSPSNSLTPSPISARKEESVIRQASEGEFTQLFRRLDSGSESNKQDTFPAYSDDVAPASPETRDGGFTQLLRTLSSSNEVDLAPSRPQPPFRQDAEGPGEFTRIMSRSNLQGTEQSKPAVTASDTPEERSVSNSEKLTPSSSPHPPFPSPQIESNNPVPPFASTPLMNSVPPTMPIAQPPHMPSAPGVSDEQYAGRFQEYLPLLLIGNIFLSLITLIFVVCLLLRRH